MGGTMKKLFLATVSVVALAGSAMAADMPVYKAAPVVAAPACAQFGGFYIGGNVGWKYYENKWSDKDWIGLDGHTAATESDNAFTAGVQAGYDWQFGCTVWGIRADWNWTNADANNYYTDVLDPDYTLNFSSKEKWYATLRTRSGIVVNNLLLYVTGGVAWAKFDRNLNYIYGGDSYNLSSSKTALGFVIGAGTEWALNQNWSINSEFLYMGFEKDSPTYAYDGDSYRFDFKDSEWVAKIGVNYRFGGAAPVVARY